MAPTFYARGDTATPVRATIASVTVNIALKFALVWGFHFGAVGIALGTALAAWVNVGVLVYLARVRGLLAFDCLFTRSLLPILIAAAATGAGAWGGAQAALHLFHAGHWQDEIMLALAVLCGGVAYGAVTLVFRRALPFGRMGRA